MNCIHRNLNSYNSLWDIIVAAGAYVGRGGGGALGARAPPTWEKSSAQKCPKEERNFRPDMSAKRNVHVPLRYHKTKTKMLGKKEENSKKKGLKLKK